MSSLKTAKAFKAIILANESSNSLYPYHESPAPGLLPILTKPILEYQFELLERSGFDQCIIVCNENDQDAITDFADQYSHRTNTSFIVRIVVTNSTQQLPAGEALRQVTTSKGNSKQKISLDCDFLILPADFISTESLTKLLAYHHYKRATMTMMLVQPPPEPANDTSKNKKGGPQKKQGPSSQSSNQLIDPRLEDPENPLYVGIDADNGRICLLRELDPDIGFKIHKDILRQVTSFTLYTNLRSPSVYVFAREALQLLHEYEDIETLDVLAQFLVGMQFVQGNPRVNHQSQANQRQAEANSAALPITPSLEPAASFNRIGVGSFYYKSGPQHEEDDVVATVGNTGDSVIYDDTDSMENSSTYVTAAATHAATTKKGKGLNHDDEFSFPAIPRLTCYSFIPPPTSLILRSDNLMAYNFLNKKLIQADLPLQWSALARPTNCLPDILDRIAREARSAVPETPEPETTAGAGATPQGKPKGKEKKNAKQQQPRVTVSGWFAEDTIMEPGVMVHNSIVGRHCRIGKNAIVKDCILMDYSTIGENAKVESTIVGTSAKVENDIEVKNEAIAANATFDGKKF